MANSPKFCSNCGQPVEEGARICEACGAKLSGRPPAAYEPKTRPKVPQQNWMPIIIAGGAIMLIGMTAAVCLLAAIVFRLYNPLASLAKPTMTNTPLPMAAVNTETPVPAVLPTNIPASTATPAETPTPVPTPTLKPNLVYGGVSFFYPKTVASGVNSQTLPANPPSDNAAPWDVAPQHTAFDFTGYALTGRFHNPRISIYPVEEFIKMEPRAGVTVEELRNLLKDQPVKTGPIPFLPYWNAAQMFHTKIAYLQFRNGSGVRFLTQYGQSVFPINNNMLFYSFQGLTSDGKYYISAVLPVENAILPANGDLDQTGYQELEQKYGAYLSDITVKLDEQADTTFKPGLDILDGMFQSLEVK